MTTDHGRDPQSPAERIAATVAIVRRRWPVALTTLALVLAIAAVHLATATPIYEARALVLLQPSDAVTATLEGGAVSPINAQRDLDTNAGLLTVAPVADAVRQRLRLADSSRALLSRVSLSGQQQSNLVTVAVRDASAAGAARIATEYARAAANYRATVARAQLQEAIDAGRASLRTMDLASRAVVSRRLRELRTAKAVQTGGMRVIQPASVPTAPASPRAGVVLATALALGLVLALAAALLSERLRRASDFAVSFAGPLLAVLPRDPQPCATATAALVASLIGQGHARDGQVLLLADAAQVPLARDVLDLVCAHLAAMGRSALLIEPERAPQIGAGEDAGGSGDPLGHGPGTLSLQHVAIDDDAGPAGAPSYAVLTMKGGEPQSGARINGGDPGAIIAVCRRLADVVLIAGSLHRSSQLGPLLNDCDAVILVADLRHSRLCAARRARGAMGDASAKLLGVVMTEHGRPRPRRRPAGTPCRRPIASPTGNTDLPRVVR